MGYFLHKKSVAEIIKKWEDGEDFDLLEKIEATGQSRVSALEEAIAIGCIRAVQDLLTKDISEDNNRALCAACHYGDMDTVKLVLKVSDPTYRNNRALGNAAEKGYIDIAKLILPHCDTRDELSDILVKTVRSGNLELLKFLLPYCSSLNNNRRALEQAVDFNNAEMTSFLLSHCDVSNGKTRALNIACKLGNLNLVEILIKSITPNQDGKNSELVDALSNGYVKIADRLVPYIKKEDNSILMMEWALSIDHKPLIDILALMDDGQETEEVVKKYYHINDETVNYYLALRDTVKTKKALTKEIYADGKHSRTKRVI